MIICGTGHRPDKLGGYRVSVHEALVDTALAWLTGDGADTVEVISGMALGWDMALADAALELGIPFTAAVPFRGQEKRWPENSQKGYNYLLERAYRVVNVCEDGYAPWKMQVRNEWMVDNSTLTLALWNGTDGGTANCVKYAQKTGKPIVNLWEEFERVRSSV